MGEWLIGEVVELLSGEMGEFTSLFLCLSGSLLNHGARQ